MQTFYQLLGIVGAGLILWLLYRTIKGRPDQFNRESINKSFLSLGILGIGLIIFVSLLVLMLRHT